MSLNNKVEAERSAPFVNPKIVKPYNHLQKILEKLRKLRESCNHKAKLEKLHYNCLQQLPTLTLFRMGEGTKKTPSASFSPVTFTNVRFGSQNFLTFSFNPFARVV